MGQQVIPLKKGCLGETSQAPNQPPSIPSQAGGMNWTCFSLLREMEARRGGILKFSASSTTEENKGLALNPEQALDSKP